MTENDDYAISIICDDWEPQEGAKDIWSYSKDRLWKVEKFNEKDLIVNLNNFCNAIGRIIQNVATSTENYELERLEMAIDITAKGEVRLVGSVSSELKSGIKLIFSKKVTKGEKM